MTYGRGLMAEGLGVPVEFMVTAPLTNSPSGGSIEDLTHFAVIFMKKLRTTPHN